MDGKGKISRSFAFDVSSLGSTLLAGFSSLDNGFVVVTLLSWKKLHHIIGQTFKTYIED